VTKYLYQARVVPIGKPWTVHDNQGQPVTWTFDRFRFSDSCARARNIPVCLSHDLDMRIGNLRSLSPNREWWVCFFELNDELGIEFDVGQNVSVGLSWHNDYLNTPRVEEISIVRLGRIPGAEITERMPWFEPKPAPAAAPPPTPAIARQPAAEVIYGGPIIRRNIGKVLAVRDNDGVETVFE